MEDLREEPELEEREEEEADEEEEEEEEEPSDEAAKQQSESGAAAAELTAETDENSTTPPVRNPPSSNSFTGQAQPPRSCVGLLETDFCVSDVSEVRTQCIRPPIRCQAKRPASLNLNDPILIKKSLGGTRLERVTARLLDQPVVK